MSEHRPIMALVVDDQEANRYALARQLARVGITVIEAGTGEEGLRLARDSRPDIVILDVELPGIDGFEVLRRLKADPETQSLPVLQTSASFVRGEHRALGLEAGADGYLVQPAEPAELIATVRALVRASRAEASLRGLNQELEDRVEERTRQLAGRTAELETVGAEQETFVYTVSHDLRAPLLAIQGMSELLGLAVEAGDREEIEFTLERIKSNVAKMSDLLDDMLALSRIGRVGGDIETIDLGSAAGAVLEDLEPRLRARGVQVDVPAEWPTVRYPRSEALQLLANLLGNATKFAGRPGAAPRVSISAESRDGLVTLRVSDNGPGVPAHQRERVFGLFQKLDPIAEGTGVGLAIVRRIVERHGGRASIEDSLEPPDGLGGATFLVTLPAERRSGKGRGAAQAERRNTPAHG